MDFDLEYNNVMRRIDILLTNDFQPKAVKKFLQSFKVDKAIIDREETQERTKDRRKEIVDWYEIKQHERKCDEKKYAQIVQSEIKKLKQRQLEKDYINNTNFKPKKGPVLSLQEEYANYNEALANSSKINRSIKIKEFNKMVNRMNISKIQQQKRKREINQSTTNGRSPPAESRKGNFNRILSSSPVPTYSPPQKKRVFSSAVFKRKAYDDNFNNIDRRKPLPKPPDYLKEVSENMRKGKGFNKFSFKKGNLQNNIDDLKYKAETYEEKAKEQRKLINLNRENFDAVAADKMSEYLCDSISAKLQLLKQMSHL